MSLVKFDTIVIEYPMTIARATQAMTLVILASMTLPIRRTRKG